MRSNGKSVSNVAINKGPRRAKPVSAVLGIAEYRLHEFNDVNIATAFNQIAHLQGGPMDLRMRFLEQRALRVFESQEADLSPRLAREVAGPRRSRSCQHALGHGQDRHADA